MRLDQVLNSRFCSGYYVLHVLTFLAFGLLRLKIRPEELAAMDPLGFKRVSLRFCYHTERINFFLKLVERWRKRGEDGVWTDVGPAIGYFGGIWSLILFGVSSLVIRKELCGFLYAS